MHRSPSSAWLLEGNHMLGFVFQPDCPQMRGFCSPLSIVRTVEGTGVTVEDQRQPVSWGLGKKVPISLPSLPPQPMPFHLRPFRLNTRGSNYILICKGQRTRVLLQMVTIFTSVRLILLRKSLYILMPTFNKNMYWLYDT